MILKKKIYSLNEQNFNIVKEGVSKIIFLVSIGTLAQNIHLRMLNSRKMKKNKSLRTKIKKKEKSEREY